MTEGQKSLEYISLTIKYPGLVVTFSLLFTTHGWGPVQAQETGGAVLPCTHKGESDCGTLSLNRAND